MSVCRGTGGAIFLGMMVLVKTLKRCIVRSCRWCFVLVFLLSTSVCLMATHIQSQKVSKAYADSTGRVHVVMGNGREVVLPQESVELPVIAGDNRTVGWQVNFPNCCTSYPIPLTVVLYRDGHIIHRIGNGRGLFRWQFVKEGEQVAYFSDTVHSNLAPECVLVDVATGKTLQKWSRGAGVLPAWAEVFADDVGSLDSNSR